MGTDILTRHFARIGARLRFDTPLNRDTRAFALDIGRDKAGEYFSVRTKNPEAIDLSAIEVRSDMRHLLLMARVSDGKEKFLCGHDERHWFVAAVPNRNGVTGVVTAMEALKPPTARWEQNRKKVPYMDRTKRRTDAYVRQGEWFFVPAQRTFDPRLVLRNEPLRRGSGKPHTVEFLVRSGGEIVYVSREYPNGLTTVQYQKLISRRPALRALNWSQMRRNPGVFVKGAVSHADHATIYLPDWHVVQMNTENEAPAMASVAFLD